ncbi:hypothetical protein D9M69_613330 [compost metagenome]
MEGEHGNAHLRDILHALGDGVVDVEEFHVEEDFFLGRNQALCKIETARKHQLIADLVERDSIAQFFDHFFCFSNGWHVEAHDQLIAQIFRRHGNLRCDFRFTASAQKSEPIFGKHDAWIK